jgi:HSP20 family molecular chaperone IbpA
MNKNLTIGIGFVLVGIIAYQGYLLYKKDHPNFQITNAVSKKAVDEPKISVHIEPKKSINQTPKQNSTPQISNSQSNLNSDEERIKKSFQNLLQSIFASKEVQEGLAEFKSQAQEGFKQMQKELQNLPKQLDNISSELKDDPIFSQFFDNIKNITASKLEDKGDYYYTKLTLPDPKNSKVDINADDKFLTIKISQKTESNSTISTKETKTLISIPNDALVQKLQSSYKNGIIEIKIPKIKNGQKI